ncbi:MAG: phenylalanine--tRNA ligase beta subunit-related protein [candidate division KSB1 bacterium]|nr:phenylalanine--tRNA ligase beta subunit-related protein [candidate division KSB1 bacterium]MDZ7341554.1 phenylalanine--tRNA ligase beta subunit-related protein [candidate division KSB1 bacterium]
MTLQISKDPELNGVVKLGLLYITQVSVRSHIPELAAELQVLAETYRQKYRSPNEALDQLHPTRWLYRQIGIDPTKNRPSSEALLRRALKGQPFYYINSIVDVCNLCSLKLLLSLGLYDVGKIVGPIRVRMGRDSEGYDGIRKDFIHVGGRLVCADDLGPFGNPSADSARTMVTLATTQVLFVIFAPALYSAEQLQHALDYLESTVKRFHACKIERKWFL